MVILRRSLARFLTALPSAAARRDGARTHRRAPVRSSVVRRPSRSACDARAAHGPDPRPARPGARPSARAPHRPRPASPPRHHRHPAARTSAPARAARPVPRPTAARRRRRPAARHPLRGARGCAICCIILHLLRRQFLGAQLAVARWRQVPATISAAPRGHFLGRDRPVAVRVEHREDHLARGAVPHLPGMPAHRSVARPLRAVAGSAVVRAARQMAARVTAASPVVRVIISLQIRRHGTVPRPHDPQTRGARVSVAARAKILRHRDASRSTSPLHLPRSRLHCPYCPPRMHAP